MSCLHSLPRSFHRSSAGITEQTAEIVPLPEVDAFQYIIGFGFELRDRII